MTDTPSTRRARAGAAALAGLLLAPAWTAPSTAFTAGSAATAVPVVAAPAAPPSREEVFADLRVDQVAADYVILVDTSGSMAADNLYGNVRRTLRTFLAGLSGNDHVAVYTFDSKPTLRYVGPAGNPDRMVAGLPAGPNPSGATDLGAALQRAVEELERPGAASVASVVLLTDGAHEPPRGSAYPDDSGPPWRALAARTARLDDRVVTGYALPLRGATGAGLLGTVLPQTTELDPTSVGELGRYLDRAKAGTRLAKARQALAGDVGKGVRASWTVPAAVDLSTDPGPTPVTLTLRSETTRAPLTVRGLRARADDGATLTGTLPDEVTLPPGQSVSFDLRLRWRPDAGPVPFRDERAIAPRLTVDGQVDSPWAGPLAPDVALETPTTIVVEPPRVRLTTVVGTWAAQVVTVLAVALVVAAVLLAAYRRRRAPLSGTLLATSPTDGAELGRFPLRGRSARLAGQRLPGRASVVARSAQASFANPDGVEYVVTYRRAAHRTRSVCPPGGSVMVSGVSFTHLPAGGPAAPPVSRVGADVDDAAFPPAGS
ncbi:VWA domain-containing protein [Micromonospora sp. WMMD882]|uniref:vWA domain-containing protein n=1 Tax=Micromonospora sp. WMMD882 TaxID=3015151 RepID=UPI00248CE656|nr:vWA domain-containing protein [Micromonospora sp. WMMD882]WBB77766.1 VWA domain-containing protein [Micromonospora sp. WMMD882]